VSGLFDRLRAPPSVHAARAPENQSFTEAGPAAQTLRCHSRSRRPLRPLSCLTHRPQSLPLPQRKPK